MKKLNIGCGGHYLKRLGYIDCDISPRSSHILKMDATQRWPFDDASVDRVSSEHCIEHITYPDGLRMLSECYRVLCPGGRVRISCPDLKFLLAYFSPENQWTPLMRTYMAQHFQISPPDIAQPTACHMLNWFVRMGQPNPGCHVFIYDEPTLASALLSVGFVDTQRFLIMQSNDEHFRGLEAEHRLSPGMLQLESMTLEATKPFNA